MQNYYNVCEFLNCLSYTIKYKYCCVHRCKKTKCSNIIKKDYDVCQDHWIVTAKPRKLCIECSKVAESGLNKCIFHNNICLYQGCKNTRAFRTNHKYVKIYSWCQEHRNIAINEKNKNNKLKQKLNKIKCCLKCDFCESRVISRLGVRLSFCKKHQPNCGLKIVTFGRTQTNNGLWVTQKIKKNYCDKPKWKQRRCQNHICNNDNCNNTPLLGFLFCKLHKMDK